MKPRITVYLSDSQLEYLRREAAKRRRSLSSYVTDCLLDYHVEAAPSATAPQIFPPFSALLRDTEERIAKEIQNRTSGANTQLSKRLMVLTAMLDRFVLSALVHTPEVPEANRSKAIGSGERRYANWREAVEKVLDALGGPSPEVWRESSDAPAREEDAA